MLRPKDRTSAQRRRNRRAEETKWRLARNRRLAHGLVFDGLEDRTLLSGGNINFQTLGQDLAADLSAIQSSVNAAYQTATAIPIIGTDLQNNTTISKLLSQFNTVATQLESLGTQANGSSVATLVQNQLLSALGPAGLNWLAEFNPPGGSAGNEYIAVTPDQGSDGTLEVEMLLTVSAATTVQFNLGLPSFLGLSVTSNVNVNLTSDYLLDFSFDPTTNALAIKNTDLTTQAAALNYASLPHDPFAITLSAQPATKTIGSGQLDNFLLATVTDNGTQLTGTIGVAIDSFNGATVSFFGEAAVNLNLSLSFGAGDIPLDPTLTTGLKFDWQFSNYQPVDTSTPNTFGSIASLEFTGVNLTTDLGTIGTIISDIQD
jgi:hypothetical protein